MFAVHSYCLGELLEKNDLGECSMHVEEEKSMKASGRKTHEKQQFGSSRHKMEANTDADFTKRVLEGMV